MKINSLLSCRRRGCEKLSSNAALFGLSTFIFDAKVLPGIKVSSKYIVFFRVRKKAVDKRQATLQLKRVSNSHV